MGPSAFQSRWCAMVRVVVLMILTHQLTSVTIALMIISSCVRTDFVSAKPTSCVPLVPSGWWNASRDIALLFASNPPKYSTRPWKPQTSVAWCIRHCCDSSLLVNYTQRCLCSGSCWYHTSLGGQLNMLLLITIVYESLFLESSSIKNMTLLWRLH